MLTVEELLPQKLRRRYITGYREIFPNQKLSWSKKIQFIIWGGERYDTRASIGKVVHPHEVCTSCLQTIIAYYPCKPSLNICSKISSFNVGGE